MTCYSPIPSESPIEKKPTKTANVSRYAVFIVPLSQPLEKCLIHMFISAIPMSFCGKPGSFPLALEPTKRRENQY